MPNLERSGGARNGLPELKPYVYKGEPEPLEVIRARQRAQAVAAQRQRDRERAEVLAAERNGTGWNQPNGDELAELTAARDRNQAALAAVPEPAPAPPPVTPASRCDQCGYLTTATGHRVMCDE